MEDTDNATSSQPPPSVVAARGAAVVDSSSLSGGSSKYSDAEQSLLDTALTRCIHEVIFPKKQFVIKEAEMAVTSSLAKRIMKEVRMSRGLWEENKRLIRSKLNRKRNNVQGAIRAAMIRKYDSTLFSLLVLPSLTSLLLLSVLQVA